MISLFLDNILLLFLYLFSEENIKILNLLATFDRNSKPVNVFWKNSFEKVIINKCYLAFVNSFLIIHPRAKIRKEKIKQTILNVKIYL